MENTGSMASALIREVVLPQIEQDVNEGRNFAGVRQVSNALILAAWFKQNLKRSLLGQDYANRNKVRGIDLQDRTIKQKIYVQYLKAFKKGVYNYIREDVDPQTEELVARKYFTGGYDGNVKHLVNQHVNFAQMAGSIGKNAVLASVDLATLASSTDAQAIDALQRLRIIKDHHYEGFPLVDKDKIFQMVLSLHWRL